MWCGFHGKARIGSPKSNMGGQNPYCSYSKAVGLMIQALEQKKGRWKTNVRGFRVSGSRPGRARIPICGMVQARMPEFR